MLPNAQKAALIFEISGHKGDVMCQNILRLLEILIQEVRVDNDTAPAEIVVKNQGKLYAYTLLQEYIVRGLPGNVNIS